MLPGGHALRPLFTEQQKAVHPDEQLASGPHSDAYAVPGRSMNRSGLIASADPTSVERNKKPRRVVFVASPVLTDPTIFSAMLMPLQLQAVEQRVHLREQPVQMQAPGDH